jgi:hypothetical protein
MKRTILVVACVSLSLAVFISRGLAGPGTADAKGKEAVEKVLKAEKYTPTVAIEGPNNSVWLVACRVFGAKAIEQVIVNVHGKTINVQMATYEPIAEGWKRNDVPSVLVADLQRKIENEIVKEK